MVLKITVHDVEEDELTNIDMYDLSQVVHRFIEEDTEAHTGGVEAIFTDSGEDASEDGTVAAEASPDVEMAADRIPDEWDVRQGEDRGEEIVFTLHEEDRGSDPTTGISILAAAENQDAEWLVEVQDVDETRDMGTLLPVAKISEFDDLPAAYEWAIECAHEYGPNGPADEMVIFEVFGVDPAEIEHAWNVDEGDPDTGYDHEAHEAATLVMYALQERFEWAEEIDGVAMGAH